MGIKSGIDSLGSLSRGYKGDIKICRRGDMGTYGVSKDYSIPFVPYDAGFCILV